MVSRSARSSETGTMTVPGSSPGWISVNVSMFLPLFSISFPFLALSFSVQFSARMNWSQQQQASCFYSCCAVCAHTLRRVELQSVLLQS